MINYNNVGNHQLEAADWNVSKSAADSYDWNVSRS